MNKFLSFQILFRSGVLSELEAKRDELLSDRIIQLQSYCRGYLARKTMAQRRVQVSKQTFTFFHFEHHTFEIDLEWFWWVELSWSQIMTSPQQNWMILNRAILEANEVCAVP